MSWIKKSDAQDDAADAVDSRVVYVNRRIAGANAGDVITVPWSAHWQGHDSAGNISVVRAEESPEYTNNVYLDDSGATDDDYHLHDDGVEYDSDSEE